MIKKREKILLKWFNKIREDEYNIKILNYILITYLFSLMISYEASGTFIWSMVLTLFLNKNFKEHLINSLKNKFVQACIIYFYVYLVWMIGSEHLSYGIAQIKYNKFFLYSILFVAIIRQEFIYKYLYVFIFGVLINMIWLYLMFFGVVSDSHYNLVAMGQGEYLLIPTDQAVIILLGISYALYRLIKFDEKTIYKIYLIIFICLASISILMLKKTAIVSYPFVILTVLIYIYRKNIFKILTIFFIFISSVILIINFLFPNVKNNLTNEARGVYSSIVANDYRMSMAARIGMAKYSLEAISDNLLFGVGTGEHIFVVRNKINESDLKTTFFQSYNTMINALGQHKSSTLHNTFLQVLVQFGIIGLIIYLNIFYQVSKYINIRTTEINSCLLLTMLIMIFLQFNTGWDFQFGNLGELFLMVVVILTSTKINNSKTIIKNHSLNH